MGAGAAQLGAVLRVHAPTLRAAWLTLRPPVVAILVTAGHEDACRKPGPQHTPEHVQCPDPPGMEHPSPAASEGPGLPGTPTHPAAPWLPPASAAAPAPAGTVALRHPHTLRGQPHGVRYVPTTLWHATCLHCIHPPVVCIPWPCVPLAPLCTSSTHCTHPPSYASLNPATCIRPWCACISLCNTSNDPMACIPPTHSVHPPRTVRTLCSAPNAVQYIPPAPSSLHCMHPPYVLHLPNTIIHIPPLCHTLKPHGTHPPPLPPQPHALSLQKQRHHSAAVTRPSREVSQELKKARMHASYLSRLMAASSGCSRTRSPLVSKRPNIHPTASLQPAASAAGNNVSMGSGPKRTRGQGGCGVGVAPVPGVPPEALCFAFSRSSWNQSRSRSPRSARSCPVHGSAGRGITVGWRTPPPTALTHHPIACVSPHAT